MELSTATATGYCRHALTQMLTVAERLGHDKVNQRPVGPDTNSVASLILHCCGVSEFWLGHVGLGRPSQRDRDSEFAKTATLDELHAAVAATVRQIGADLEALEAIGAGGEPEFAAGREFLLHRDESDGSLIVHVIEELYQHLGHAELTADVLLAAA
ncbi:MAG: mycothiol transferase [Microthrixaceae bacterium]